MTTVSLLLLGLAPPLILLAVGAITATVRLGGPAVPRRRGGRAAATGRRGVWSALAGLAHRRARVGRSRHRRVRGTSRARHAWTGGSAPRQQPAYRAVEIEELWLTTPRHRNVRAAKEPDKYAARYLEQRVAVRRRERERDEVTAWGGPWPDPDVADPGWLVQPADQKFPGERPTDRLASG